MDAEALCRRRYPPPGLFYLQPRIKAVQAGHVVAGSARPDAVRIVAAPTRARCRCLACSVGGRQSSRCRAPAAAPRLRGPRQAVSSTVQQVLTRLRLALVVPDARLRSAMRSGFAVWWLMEEGRRTAHPADAQYAERGKPRASKAWATQSTRSREWCRLRRRSRSGNGLGANRWRGWTFSASRAAARSSAELPCILARLRP